MPASSTQGFARLMMADGDRRNLEVGATDYFDFALAGST
jgi:hypothetical protein